MADTERIRAFMTEDPIDLSVIRANELYPPREHSLPNRDKLSREIAWTAYA
jgi:hypothetical protein